MAMKLLGIDLLRVTTVAENELGIIVEDVRGGSDELTIAPTQPFPVGGSATVDGPAVATVYSNRYSASGKFRYVRADETVTSGDAVMIDVAATAAVDSFSVTPVTAITDAVEGIAIVG